jgi:hypothetical protein
MDGMERHWELTKTYSGHSEATEFLIPLLFKTQDTLNARNKTGNPWED